MEVVAFYGVKRIELERIAGVLNILEIEDKESNGKTEVHIEPNEHFSELKMDWNEKGILSLSSIHESKESFGNVNVYGNGNVVINGRKISTFSSPQYKITIKVPKNEIKHVMNKSAMDIITSLEHKYEISMSGSGDLHVKNAKGISCVSSGSGDIEINNVSDTYIAASGSGDIEINGADQIKVESKGSGDIQVLGTEVRFIEMKLKGSGDLRILPLVHQLNIESKGSGDITLKNSVIHENINIKGSGRIRRKG